MVAVTISDCYADAANGMVKGSHRPARPGEDKLESLDKGVAGDQ